MPQDWMNYLLVILAIAVAFYVYTAVALGIIARKTGTPGGWMAWIPLLNVLLMCRIARKPGWWILLLFIPFLNLVIGALIWMGIARARGKPAWTGILILVPPVSVLIPAYLAAGEGASAAAGSGASYTAPTAGAACSSCGTPATPGEAFCGECGQPLTAAPPVAPASSAPLPVQPLKPAGQRSHIGLMVAAAVLLAAVAAFAWFFAYTPPKRQAPAMPQRMAGVLKEFPVDTDPKSPARPIAVSSQSLRAGTPNLQAKRLPPGVTTDRLRKSGQSITSATYKRKPEEPPVEVHVIDTAGSPGAGRDIERSAKEGAGPDARETSVQLQSPTGSTYQGWKILSPRIEVYILQGLDSVVIVYAPDPAVRDVADRLAGDVGNGGGLSDYPEVQNSLWSLPAEPPPGFDLDQIYSYQTNDLISPEELKAAFGGGPDTDQWIAKAQPYLPRRITTATYHDRARAEWRVAVGDFGSSFKATMVWNLVRWWVSAATAGNPLLVHRGPYLAVILGPDRASPDQLNALARGIQF